MSIVNEDGERVVLPREPGVIYGEIQRSWRNDPVRLKQLAWLQLHEFLDWPMEMIGTMSGVHHGTVSRGIRSVRKALLSLERLKLFQAK